MKKVIFVVSPVLLLPDNLFMSKTDSSLLARIYIYALFGINATSMVLSLLVTSLK